ncbi:MAG TPA: hypothetical protein VNK49_13030 [Anaerolineales bacterium]|nr:hypothetical protein [Anaerolineales bacterium]
MKENQTQLYKNSRALFGDVTLHEDATRMTVGNTVKVMALLNNLVLALVRTSRLP